MKCPHCREEVGEIPGDAFLIVCKLCGAQVWPQPWPEAATRGLATGDWVALRQMTPADWAALRKFAEGGAGEDSR